MINAGGTQEVKTVLRKSSVAPRGLNAFSPQVHFPTFWP